MAERFIPRAQEIYRHFKGNLYQVVAVAEHTETGEQLVIYQALYGDFKIYARPLEMFTGPVDLTKYPDADQEFRFRLQGLDAGRQRAESGRQNMPGTDGGEDMPGTDDGEDMPGTGERGTMSRMGEGKRAGQSGLGNSAETVYGRKAAGPEGMAGNFSKAGASPGKPEVESQTAAAGAESQGQTAYGEPEAEEPGLDPLVLEFLDARTYEERLNVLAALHHRITNEMITTMSLCCDIEVQGDDVEQRYEDLKQCLITKERFEIKRLM